MKNFRLIYIFSWVTLLAVIGGITDPLAAIESCEPTTNKVQVLVEQDSQDPSLYEYTLVNNSQSPIYTFRLEALDDPEQDRLSGYTNYTNYDPEMRFSPAGWKFVENIYAFESNDIFYTWLPVDIKNRESFVAQGASLGGFKMKMPQPSEELKTLSFQVDTLPGCFTGKVQPK